MRSVIPKPGAVKTRLLNTAYERRPGLRHVATHETTSLFLVLAHHPFHMRTLQRLQQVDPEKLQIRVSAPKQFSHSAFIKNRALHRFRGLLAERLCLNGWNYDGSIIESAGDAPDGQRKRAPFRLSGAYAVMLSKDTELVLNATSDEIRSCCDLVVENLIELHEYNNRRSRWEARQRGTRALEP